MAALSLMRILRFCSPRQPNSTFNSSTVNYMIRMASLMSAISGLYLLPGSPLQSFLPSARFAVLVSLFPHVWHSLLSWITPSCLFVILNCIIITLTLTSGSFKGLSSARPELHENVVMKMEAVHRLHMDNSPPKACKRSVVVPVQAIALKELEEEESVAAKEKTTENYDDDDDDALAMDASDPAKRSAWHSQPASPTQKQAAKGVRRAKSIDSSSMHVMYSTNSKHEIRHGFTSSCSASVSCTSSLLASSSSPSSSATTSSYSSSSSSSSSSDTLSTPSSPFSPSSPCNPNDNGCSSYTQSDPWDADDLSDEDLRERIEAFISRMNAHMRREAATSSMEY